MRVLQMEERHRGITFGKKLPIRQETMRFVPWYHGYFFAWATICTFLHYPLEPASGHLVRFFYMFLPAPRTPLQKPRVSDDLVPRPSPVGAEGRRPGPQADAGLHRGGVWQDDSAVPVARGP